MKFYTSAEKYGNFILHRGYNNGKRFSERVKFQPTFFMESREESEHTTFIGLKYLKPKTFDSISDAKDFLERYEDVSGFAVYGNSNFVTQFLQETYPDQIEFDINQINIASFDIEVDVSEKFPDMELADNEITSISYKSSKSDTYYLLARKDFDKSKTETGVDTDYIQFMKFGSEKELLRRFIQIWSNDYPDIVTGWNVEYFDIYYVIMRILKLFGEEKTKELSPWGLVPRRKTKKIFHRNQSTFEISGVGVIDFMDAFKKFGYKYGPQESYKLDHIAQVVLGEKKIDYSEYGSLTELYRKNPQKYLDYSLKDTVLIQRMEDESALLSLVLTVAYNGGVNYKEAFGTVGIWESILYRKLMPRNVVPPVKTSPGEQLGELVGGYVKDPIPGIHNWIISFDLDSLYPHLMLQYNMSPETYLSDHREDVNIEKILRGEYRNANPEYSVCANGACFTNKKLGVIPEIVSDYYAKRKSVKDRMLQLEQVEENESNHEKKKIIKKQITQLHNMQMSIKILLNSLYGATANRYFLYYISAMAEAITTSGQLSIRTAEKTINRYMNSVLKTENVDYTAYIDTDSAYIDMSHLILKIFNTIEIDRNKAENFLLKVAKEKLTPKIKEGYEELALQMGSYRNAMSMKLEKITDKTIFLGKKRYLMNALNSEGVHYEEPKISMTGVEAIRSSTPEICRNKMKELFKIILNQTEEEMQKFIADFKEEFFKLSPNEIGKTTGTDDIDKFVDQHTVYKKGCPIHVRGAILYNKHLIDKKLITQYEPIRSGDKVKFVYLKLPNPIRENIISFTDNLPKEFELEAYIDYETQFEKVFNTPMNSILKEIGWNSEKIDTLESFFG